MEKYTNRGFTLIELMVVIAIVGVISAIVLTTLTSTRGKGNNAAVRAQMGGVRTQAAVYYDSHLNYTGICSDPQVVKILEGASQAGAGNTTSDKCYDSSSAFVATVPFKQAEGVITYWCVDSTDKSKGITTAQNIAITSAATLCP